MPGIFPYISGPPQGSVLRRNAILSGGVSPFNGTVQWVEIQFGVGGPTVDITNPNGGFITGWSGIIPGNIAAGQTFQIIVRAGGMMETRGFPEPEFESVDGESAWTYTLENVTPSVTVDPFQTPAGTKDPAYLLAIGGSASTPDPSVYGVPQVRARVDDGAFVDATMSGATWAAQLTVPPGDHQITVQAVDAFGTTAAVQQPITVLQYAVPTAPTAARRTPAGIPTTASITSWTRLEPQVTNADIGLSAGARLFDPLWLLTRQFQMGEFQAEDAGSPVQARLRATSAPLTRCYLGELPLPAAGATPTPRPAPPYDPARAPLETMVERRRMRPADDGDPRMLRLAVEAGLHFLRMLDLDAAAKKYRAAFLAAYLLRQPPSTAPAGDDGARRFVQAMAGRAPDARRLASALRRPGTTQIVLDPSLAVAAADVAAVQRVAAAWLAWYDGLFAEPAGAADDAWAPARLEYAVSVAARLSAQPQDGVTLSASEFDGGRLDWSSFDVNQRLTIDTTADRAFAPLDETTVPAPVSFPGAPAPRFWEVEDARLAYGLVPAGPTDLAHLLMIEYASSYGNDWFVVPVTVPVGTLTRVDSLVVTDSFGVRSLVRPIGDPSLPAPHFSLWQQSTRRFAGDPPGAPVPNRFFVPPTLGQTVDGPVLEDVLFMRDEMANLAWGIERTVEGAVELPVSLTGAAPPNGPAAVVPTPGTETYPHYVLASHVAENWIPMLPVQLTDRESGKVLSWLKRGMVLQATGEAKPHAAQSEVVRALRAGLLYDEEVPREGVRITRRRRMTRWTDGSCWVWAALRNEVGSGEGSAGLEFDQLRAPDPSAPLASDAPPTVAAPSFGQTSLTIGGPAGTFTTRVANAGRALLNVTLQGWISQGTARRAVGGETPLDCRSGSGAGVLPNGSFAIAGAIAASNAAGGVGTLVPGAATFELQVKQGATVLATARAPVTLVATGTPSIAALSTSPAFAFLDATNASFAATLANPGASLSNVVLRGWVTQGTARRAAAGATVHAPPAPDGVLPTGTLSVSGPIFASNESGGSGALVPGPATFELQLVVNDAVVHTRTVPITLQPNGPGIAALGSSAGSVRIGASAPYAATLRNPGPSLSNMVLQGWIAQNGARRAAGGVVVLVGAGNGVLPTGSFDVTGSIVASNATSGSGTLVPGAATFELQLTMDGTLVESRTIPVVLTA